MANPDPIPSSIRQSVAEQVARFISDDEFVPPSPASNIGSGARELLPGQRPNATPGEDDRHLGEGYARVFVPLADVRKPPADLSAILSPKGRWVHLVRGPAGATNVCYSTDDGPEDQRVTAGYAGLLAQKIDAAAQWLDENDKDDNAVVRLLAFPAFYTHAFGILRGKKAYAVLVDAPTDSEGLEYKKEYSLRVFLRRLRELPHT